MIINSSQIWYAIPDPEEMSDPLADEESCWTISSFPSGSLRQPVLVLFIFIFKPLSFSLLELVLSLLLLEEECCWVCVIVAVALPPPDPDPVFKLVIVDTLLELDFGLVVLELDEEEFWIGLEEADMTFCLSASISASKSPIMLPKPISSGQLSLSSSSKFSSFDRLDFFMSWALELNGLFMDDALGGIVVAVGRLIEAPFHVRKKSVSTTDLFHPLIILENWRIRNHTCELILHFYIVYDLTSTRFLDYLSMVGFLSGKIFHPSSHRMC